MHSARGLGIEREAELLVPVEMEPCPAERVVAIAGAGPMPSQIGGVRGDFIGDHSLADVIDLGQAQVLLGSDIAEHARAVPAGDAAPIADVM